MIQFLDLSVLLLDDGDALRPVRSDSRGSVTKARVSIRKMVGESPAKARGGQCKATGIGEMPSVAPCRTMFKTVPVNPLDSGTKLVAGAAICTVLGLAAIAYLIFNAATN